MQEEMITEKDIKEWAKDCLTTKYPLLERRIFVFWGTEKTFKGFLDALKLKK
jgi:hypothetical protein